MTLLRPFGATPVIIMLLLCLSWALQQVAVKLALPEVGPMLQGALRSTAATALLGLYLLWRRQPIDRRAAIVLPGLFCGLLFGIEFVMLYQSLAWTDAARVVMFLYTAPFFVAIGGHLWFPGERLDLLSVAGIVVAFAGVVIALQPPDGATSLSWLGDLLALGAGALWGMTTLIIKGTRLKEAPPSQVLFYQLAVSAVLFWVFTTGSGEPVTLPRGGVAIASLLYQTLWVATVSYAIWFVMITRYSPTRLSVVTFVTPLYGAALGVLMLGETLGIELLAAVLAVATGILLVSLPRRPERQLPRGL